ncbi:MAG: hypothetical protein R3B45_10095 [Bdellovibrionota bacterium]
MRPISLLILVFALSSCRQKLAPSSLLSSDKIDITTFKSLNASATSNPRLTISGLNDYFDMPESDGVYRFVAEEDGVANLDLSFTTERNPFPSSASGKVTPPRVHLGRLDSSQTIIDLEKIDQGVASASYIRFSAKFKVKKDTVYAFSLQQPAAAPKFDIDNTLIDLNLRFERLAAVDSGNVTIDMKSENRGYYYVNSSIDSRDQNEITLQIKILNNNVRIERDALGLFQGSLSIYSNQPKGTSCLFELDDAYLLHNKKQYKITPNKTGNDCTIYLSYAVAMKDKAEESNPDSYYRLKIRLKSSGVSGAIPILTVDGSLSRETQAIDEKLSSDKAVLLDYNSNYMSGQLDPGITSEKQGFDFRFKDTVGSSEAYLTISTSASLIMPINIDKSDFNNLNQYIMNIEHGGYTYKVDMSPDNSFNAKRTIKVDLKKPLRVYYKFPHRVKETKGFDNVFVSYLNVDFIKYEPLPSLSSKPSWLTSPNSDNKDTMFYPDYGIPHASGDRYKLDTTHGQIWAEDPAKTRYWDNLGASTYPNLSGPQTTDRTSRPLKKSVVYKAMEKVRNYYHSQVEVEHIPDLTEKNYVDKYTIQGCLNNEAKHWSDLTLHFYCQFGQMRSCYTGFIRNNANNIPSMDTKEKQFNALKRLRIDAFEYCAAQGRLVDDPSFKGNVAQDMIEWNWLMDANNFVKVTNPSTGSDEEYSLASIFEYVMTSSTFMFFMGDEQELLNVYYRVEDSKTQCEKRRIRRVIDPVIGISPNHCEVGKVHNPKLEPAMR